MRIISKVLLLIMRANLMMQETVVRIPHPRIPILIQMTPSIAVKEPVTGTVDPVRLMTGSVTIRQIIRDQMTVQAILMKTMPHPTLIMMEAVLITMPVAIQVITAAMGTMNPLI